MDQALLKGTMVVHNVVGYPGNSSKMSQKEIHGNPRLQFYHGMSWRKMAENQVITWRNMFRWCILHSKDPRIWFESSFFRPFFGCHFLEWRLTKCRNPCIFGEWESISVSISQLFPLDLLNHHQLYDIERWRPVTARAKKGTLPPLKVSGCSDPWSDWFWSKVTSEIDLYMCGGCMWYVLWMCVCNNMRMFGTYSHIISRKIEVGERSWVAQKYALLSRG